MIVIVVWTAEKCIEARRGRQRRRTPGSSRIDQADTIPSLARVSRPGISTYTPLPRPSSSFCGWNPHMHASETVRRADLPQRATLVLHRSWRPVHVITVRRALCMACRDSVRIVCPESLVPHSFGTWTETSSPTKAPSLEPGPQIAPGPTYGVLGSLHAAAKTAHPTQLSERRS